MPRIEVKLFDNDVEKFIASLGKPTAAKVLRSIDLLEEFGSELGMPHSRKISHRLCELRIRGRQHVRIFYLFTRSTAVLLHGFVKKSPKTPRREIERAIRKMQTI